VTIRIAPLSRDHRPAVEQIVRATGVFSQAEIAVALELFDDALRAEMENGKSEMGEGETRPNDEAMQGSHSPFPISHFRSSTSDYEFIGAFDSERLIGYACFGATPATDRTYDLYWIAVHPDAQGGGAGTALMSELEHRLEGRRARLLVIDTSSRDDYAPTRRFYHKRGYEEAARLRDFYAPGDDRVVLSKRFGSTDPGGSVAARPLPA
jgi:ribosomal protein S18 acetylase RimI-like enzyme